MFIYVYSNSSIAQIGGPNSHPGVLGFSIVSKTYNPVKQFDPPVGSQSPLARAAHVLIKQYRGNEKGVRKSVTKQKPQNLSANQ